MSSLKEIFDLSVEEEAQIASYSKMIEKLMHVRPQALPETEISKIEEKLHEIVQEIASSGIIKTNKIDA